MSWLTWGYGPYLMWSVSEGLVMNCHRSEDDRLIAPRVPEEGDSIYIEGGMGRAKVKRLWHTSYDNFIEVEILDTAFGHSMDITYKLGVMS